MADFRRGASHQKPEIIKSKRDNFSNNRSQKTMNSTKCTLCGVKTEVPFTPTPGKPIRCRDCMSKVKEGKASKDELSKEREILMKARSRASKEAGMKLFVASLDYEVTEDELKQIFSKFGEIKDLHIASDRETGKSKGFAFVTFQNNKDGKKAISELNKKEFNGRKISVQESRQDSSRNRNNRNRK
jgi:CxxC-x17-CxxC domain-containing protein